MKIINKFLIYSILIIFSCNFTKSNPEIDAEYSVINQAVPQLNVSMLDLNTYMPYNNFSREWFKKKFGYCIQLSPTEKEEFRRRLNEKEVYYNDELIDQFEILIFRDSLKSIQYDGYGYKESIPIDVNKINVVDKCLFVNESDLLAKKDENYNRYLRFSRVLFDEKKEKALFRANIGSVGSSRDVFLIFLEKRNGAWLVVREEGFIICD